ncbi:efflux RND transporter periplasmic adaptor subunit [Oscillospiraceae bacterium LTW-04]|nr:efflux RND transporter periplasmic adaptor subunit [Oscillospiraceae bacterium MB24-C1]
MLENNQVSSVSAGEQNIATQPDKNKEIAHFTKKRPKKKIWIIVIIVLLVAAVALKLLLPKDSRPIVSTSPISKGSLESRITLNGRVESDAASRVYSSETGLVTAVNVKVGDKVVAGDILCQLDTTDLERSIKIQETAINNAVKKAKLALSESQADYQNLLDDLQTDQYSELINAQQTLNYAQREYTDARRSLDDHKDEQEYADELLSKLERTLNLARIELSRAKKDYNNALKSGEGVSEAYAAMQEKEGVYDSAFKEWEEANDEYGDDVTVYSKDYRLARLKYNDALENKELVERTATRRLVELKNAVERNTISADMTEEQLNLEKLQQALSDSTVKASITGTVTAVYALEGMPGNGLLFVIEDTEQLVVKTSVREYDIAAMREGMPAIIKSDATGEREFDGKVLRIAPAAAKNEDGSTAAQNGGTVEFATDVSLDAVDSALRIGMNVRLNIILKKKDDALSVPYDAVTTDENGDNVVFVARADEEGNYTAESIPVETGMETDFSIEISSDALAEGDLIITDPISITSGAEIRLSPESAVNA